MSRIFISYRRSDASAEAGRIYDYLERHFGRESIFMNVDVLEAGDDFRQRINEAVSQCQVLLAVMGKDWLQAKDSLGRRRLDNPADWVRLEIETALRRNIRVIPVVSEGVSIPAGQDLPESLRPLAYRQAAQVHHNHNFRRDVERLLGVIRKQLSDAAQQPSKKGATREVETRQAARQHQDSGRMNDWRPSASSRRQFTRTVAVQTPERSVSSPLPLEMFAAVKKVVGRRTILKAAIGYFVGGLGIAAVGRLMASFARLSSVEIPLLVPDSSGSALQQTEFDVVTVNPDGSFDTTLRKIGDFFSESLADGIALEMMRIPGGTFTMGSPPSEKGRDDNEGPQHDVTAPEFFMGKYPVTQAQWRAVAALPKVQRDLNPSPSDFEGDNRPVEQVSWEDAVEFCERLTAKTGKTYRLPSEAE